MAFNRPRKTRISITITLLISFCFLVAAESYTDVLNHAIRLDQQHRLTIQQLKISGENHKKINQLRASQRILDQQNISTLHDLVKKIGHWPGIDDVGENMAKTALVIVKHASVEQQATLLPKIKQAVLSQQIKPEWYADLFDQWLMQQDLPQAYGTLMMKGKGQQKKLFPIQPIKQVNQQRAEIGLVDLQHRLTKQKLWLRPNLYDEKYYELVPIKTFERLTDPAIDCLKKMASRSKKARLDQSENADTMKRKKPILSNCAEEQPAVYNYWLLVKTLKLFPKHPYFEQIRKQLAHDFGIKNIQKQFGHLQTKVNHHQQKLYSMAWYLTVAAELHSWTDAQAQQWYSTLQPIETQIKSSIINQFSQLTPPINSNRHSQDAFAIALMLDYSRIINDINFEQLLINQVNRLYASKEKCPIDNESSNQNLFSACLAEADLMRRVMSAEVYRKWLKKRLPQIKHNSHWLRTVEPNKGRDDRNSAYANGLNISRAWMLEGIASALPNTDKRRKILLNQSTNHRRASLSTIINKQHNTNLWLKSFALYFLTQTGV